MKPYIKIISEHQGHWYYWNIYSTNGKPMGRSFQGWVDREPCAANARRAAKLFNASIKEN